MRGDTGQFATDYPRDLGPGRQFVAHQLLHRTGVGHVVGQRRQVVESIGIWDKLVPCHVFRNLLIPAVQIPDIAVRFGDHLAVQLQHQAQNPVGAWMGGADVEDELLSDIQLGGHLRRAGERVTELQGGGRGTHRFFSSAGRARGSRSCEKGAGLVTNGPPSSGALAVKAISGISVGKPSRGKSLRSGWCG